MPREAIDLNYIIVSILLILRKIEVINIILRDGTKGDHWTDSQEITLLPG